MYRGILFKLLLHHNIKDYNFYRGILFKLLNIIVGNDFHI